jgi:hypothetical protein
MTADRLLQFYPRAWRERYGSEFLDLVGTGDLRAKQVLDISMGAVDAWLSADVRRMADANTLSTNHRGEAMLAALKSSCGTKFTMTPWEMFISTSLMLGGTLAMLGAGVALRRTGYADTSEFIMNLSFTIPFAISMYYTYLRKQPLRVRAAIMGILLFILVGASILATKI